MAAVFRVHLRETKHFAVGERSAKAFAQLLEVGNFFGAQCKTFLHVVLFHIVDVDNWVGSFGDGEDVVVKNVIYTLQHLVEFWLFATAFGEFLNARDSRKTHVLGDFDGVSAPRRNHFATRPYKCATNDVVANLCCAVKKPTEFFCFRG